MVLLVFCLFSWLGSVCLFVVCLFGLFVCLVVLSVCVFFALFVIAFTCSIFDSFTSGLIGSKTVCHLPEYQSTFSTFGVALHIFDARLSSLTFVSACIDRHFHSLSTDCRPVRFHQRCLAKSIAAGSLNLLCVKDSGSVSFGSASCRGHLLQ